MIDMKCGETYEEDVERRMKRMRSFGVVVALAAGLAALPGVAFAHVEASPTKVKVGVTTMIGFTVPHGCAGSPTTRLAIKLPAGVRGATGVAKKGWNVKTSGGVVIFAGGSLAAKTTSVFRIKASMPATPGTLEFPTIQTCVKGETAWIEPTLAGQPEPDHPAPQVVVVR